ncbi:hypothetical protein D1115_22540 (plasmid) [Vibrio alfacsensis]|uniref:Uncharacterized protein n=1 Tax=Vibrio alfacsensis TaxID=1074311 RepID=A0ABM6Z0J2_9VIBR|nr:hypothetical protein [Vibrio alfacsensis]AXY03671.1 hypothetical protein D1115_22540 [Vibrio alfacsensis]
MNKNKITSAILLPSIIWFPPLVAAECDGDTCNEHMVVMAEPISDGTMTITDPKLPRQPLRFI